MVQECLTNVHRHSNSPTAGVRIVHEHGQLRVEIRDAGKGIPLEKQSVLSTSQQSGVGFRGMRERIQQLGGVLEIQSDEHGTVVKASMADARFAGASASKEVALVSKG